MRLPPILILTVAGGFAAAAATAGQANPRERPPVKPANGAPADSPAAASGLLPGYRIGPGDILGVEVWKEPEASIPSVVVRPDGRIALPIVGEMAAAGLTPSELQAHAVERLSRIIRDARVTVHVREIHSQRVYVIGEVRREGAVQLSAPLTVLQTLAEAGGLSEFAERKKIYILRSQDGKQIRLPFDYDAVLRGQKAEQNINLQAGDTVVVPR